MILHNQKFDTLAAAPIKRTDVVVAKQTVDTYGYFDGSTIWTSSDALMSVSIDSIGSFLGTATKKAVVKLLGIVSTAASGDLFQIRLGLYDADPAVGAFNYISEGFFIVDTVEYDYESGSTTVVMYDHMWTANNLPYIETATRLGFTFPMTVNEYATRLASAIGIELMYDFSALPNADHQIPADPYITMSNATIQTVIGEIAGATGTTARISDMILIFSQYNVSSETLDSNNLKTLTIGKKYGPVNSVAFGRVPQNDNIVIANTGPSAHSVSAVDTSTNLLTVVGNSLSNGNLVRLESNGTYPEPLQPDTNYYVFTNGDPDTFALTLTPEDGIAGTNLIDIITTGSGSLGLAALSQQEIQINNNQIVDDYRQILLQPVYNKLVGIEWNETKADTTGLGWHEVGDVIQFSQDTLTTSHFVDTFDRTVSSGWGSEQHGGDWSVFGGNAAAHSVDGEGKITPSSLNVSYYEILSTIVQGFDTEVLFRLTEAPTGASNSFSLIGCWQDTSNHMRFRVTVNTTGTVVLSITMVLSGVETVIDTVTVGSGYTSDQKWRINGVFDGIDNYSVFLWRDGDAKPSSPNLSAVDSTYTTGKIGIRVFKSTGATNATTFVVTEIINNHTQSYLDTLVTRSLISEIHLVLAGSIKENIISVIPDITAIDRQTAGGILSSIYNTEIKTDKQGQDITSIVSRQDTFENQVTDTFAQVYQDIDEVTTTFQSSGGSNLILNSVGYSTSEFNLTPRSTYDDFEPGDYIAADGTKAATAGRARISYLLPVTVGDTLTFNTWSDNYKLIVRTYNSSSVFVSSVSAVDNAGTYTIPTGVGKISISIYNPTNTEITYQQYMDMLVSGAIRPTVTVGGRSMLTNWQVLSDGVIDSSTSPESQSKGALSGHRIDLASGTSITQRIIVQENSTTQYSLSFIAKKGIVGVATVSLTNTSDTHTVTIPDNTEVLWEKYEISGITPTVGYLDLTLTVDATVVDFSITDIMVNVGANTIKWTQANGELLNTQVSLNSDGITVKSSVYDGDYTAITPLEFAGYSNASGTQQRVFSLNRDTTVVQKLESINQITMAPIKIVPILSGTRAGWSFVKPGSN